MYEILFWAILINILTIDIFIFYYVFKAYKSIKIPTNLEALDGLLANSDKLK